MSVTLIDITPNAEALIAECAAICYDADTSPGANERRVKKLMNVRHLATLRFAHAVFRVKGISRVCSHQMVRHPHLSFLQRSQRYCSEFDNEVVVPKAIAENQAMLNAWEESTSIATHTYQTLIKAGVRKEDARFILPQATTTEMYVAGNFQAWFDFLVRRLDKHAQHEIRKVAAVIYANLRNHCPNIFNEGTIGLPDSEIFKTSETQT